MKKEIQEIIEKNLPAQVGNVLKKRLEQADKEKEELATAKGIIAEIDGHLATTKESLGGAKDQLARHDSLSKREKAVEKAEREQKIFELTTQLNASTNSNSQIINFVDSLMRNVKFRENIFTGYQEHFKNDGTYQTVKENEAKEAVAE